MDLHNNACHVYLLALHGGVSTIIILNRALVFANGLITDFEQSDLLEIRANNSDTDSIIA